MPIRRPALVRFVSSPSAAGQSAAKARANPKSSTFATEPVLLLLQEDVLRLEVAMDQAAPVRGGEGVAQAAEDEEGFRRRERQARCEALAQRLAFEQFHDQEGRRS